MLRLILCGIVVALTPAIARAGDLQTVSNSVTVLYADLDLTHQPGARALLHRIASAARTACGPAPDIREIQERTRFADCVSKAATSAVAAVGSPLVDELYGSSGPASGARLADR
jgi:UrcA family protein